MRPSGERSTGRRTSTGRRRPSTSTSTPRRSGRSTTSRTSTTAPTDTWRSTRRRSPTAPIRCVSSRIKPNGDSADTAISVTVSNAVAAPPPPPVAPTNTATPSVSGTTTVGQTLSASVGTWTGTTPITYTRVWERCIAGACAAIPGASGPTYTLVSVDVGATTPSQRHGDERCRLRRRALAADRGRPGGDAERTDTSLEHGCRRPSREPRPSGRR